MSKVLVSIAVAVLFAAPAFAANEWTQCNSTNTITTTPTASAGTCQEYRWDANTGATTFRVSGDSALVLFDPNLASGSVPGTPAEIMVQTCLQGYPVSDLVCGDMLDATLNGTEGAPGTQRFALRVPRGLYRIVLSVAPTSVTASIQIRGE